MSLTNKGPAGNAKIDYNYSNLESFLLAAGEFCINRALKVPLPPLQMQKIFQTITSNRKIKQQASEQKPKKRNTRN